MEILHVFGYLVHYYWREKTLHAGLGEDNICETEWFFFTDMYHPDPFTCE